MKFNQIPKAKSLSAINLFNVSDKLLVRIYAPIGSYKTIEASIATYQCALFYVKMSFAWRVGLKNPHCGMGSTNIHIMFWKCFPRVQIYSVLNHPAFVAT